MENKGILIFAPLFILALIGISFYGGPISYMFFWTVFLIPPVCFLYIFCVISSIKIYQQTDGRSMVCGTPSELCITLQNESWFSFSHLRIIFFSSFYSVSEMDDGFVYELPPHSSVQKNMKLVCRYRGEYCIGIKQIVVKDFLCLFSVSYRIREPLQVIVSPAIVHLSLHDEKELLLDADRDNMLKKTVPDIPVREYLSGDDIRSLNWKASAVMQKLMIREQRGEEKSGIAIVMDPGRYADNIEEYLPSENKIIEQVIALTLYYIEKNIPVNVIYRTETVNKTLVTSINDFDSFYNEMSAYTFHRNFDMKNFLEELNCEPMLLEFHMLIFVLQNWSLEEGRWLEEWNTGQMPVRVYAVQKEAEKNHEKIIAKAIIRSLPRQTSLCQKAGINYEKISYNSMEIIPVEAKPYTEVIS